MISKLTTLTTAGPNDEDSDDESSCEDSDSDFDEESYHRQVWEIREKANVRFSNLQKAPRLQTTQQVDRCKNHRHRVSSQHVQSAVKGDKHMAQTSCALFIVILKQKNVNNQHYIVTKSIC